MSQSNHLHFQPVKTCNYHNNNKINNCKICKQQVINILRKITQETPLSLSLRNSILAENFQKSAKFRRVRCLKRAKNHGF